MRQHSNIGVPEQKEKKKGYEKIFEDIIVENFPKMGKEIVNQVQEEQRVPYRINTRRNMARTRPSTPRCYQEGASPAAQR